MSGSTAKCSPHVECWLICLALLAYYAVLYLVADVRTDPAWPRLLLPSGVLVATAWGMRRWQLRAALRGGRFPGMCGSGGMLLTVMLAGYLLRAEPWGSARPGFMLEALGLIFLVPLAEELFFRGLLLPHLCDNAGQLSGVTLSSMLFALLHGSAGAVLPMLVLALLLAGVALATRSVWWSFLLHSQWNAAATLGECGESTWRWPFIGAVLAGMMALIIRGALTPERGR